MKRLIVAAAAAVVLVLLVSGPAFADGGPHGGYTATTDACAGCHRAHTAEAPNLLVSDESLLCLTCHGTTGPGADTNVEDGIYQNRTSDGADEGILDRGLRGGGFESASMNTDFGGPPATTATSSMHTYDGAPGTAWGKGAIGSGPGEANFQLSCANCHDPHGNGNYRILREIPINSGGAGVAIADEPLGSKSYTVADANGVYMGELGFDVAYEAMSAWCEQCHTRYMAVGDSANTDSTDPDFRYRHRTDADNGPGCGAGNCHTDPDVGLVGDFGQHNPKCMSCHVAHGSSASMDGMYSGSVDYPDGAAPPAGEVHSALLRVDNRGTCQACHKQGW